MLITVSAPKVMGLKNVTKLLALRMPPLNIMRGVADPLSCKVKVVGDVPAPMLPAKLMVPLSKVQTTKL